MARPASIWRRKDRTGWFATIDGKKVRLGDSRQEAERAFHALRAARGVRVGPDATPFGVLADMLLTHVRVNRKPATYSCYRHFLEAAAGTKVDGGLLADVPATDLRPSHLTDVFTAHPRWGPAVRRMVSVIVLRVLNWAAKEGRIEKNPLSGKVDLPPARSRGRDAVWSDADYALVLRYAATPLGELVKALRLTGCRPGEVASVRAEDTDLVRGQWVLDRHKSDADGMPRVVHLSPAMVEMSRRLLERTGGSGVLFLSGRGCPWTIGGMTSSMSKVRAKIEAAGHKLTGRAILYGLRHTFATELLTAGVPDAHVAALLGHKSTGVLHKHYNHLTGNPSVLKSHLVNLAVGVPDTGTSPPALPGAA